MAHQPTSEQLKTLQEALLSSLKDFSDLQQMVKFHLSAELTKIVPTENRTLTEMVYDLIRVYAAQDDGLHQLMDAAHAYVPQNELLNAALAELRSQNFSPLPLPENFGGGGTVFEGDAIDGDQIQGVQIHGDKAGGDIVGGNKTTTGNIDGSIAAIGGNVEISGPVYLGGAEKPEAESDDPAPGDPPYLGLNYFTAAHAHLYFGRDALTAELVELLSQYNQGGSRFLAVIGASGSGKSSLVRAGLVPALAAGKIDGSNRWEIRVVTPTARPLESLAISLTQERESVTAADTLMQDMAKTANALHLYVRRLMTERAADERMLLVVDQFEELFTLCKDQEAQAHFVNNLMTAAQTNGPTVVVLTLRADFYAQCANFDDLRIALEGQQKYIGAMSEEELRQAIVEPANRNGWAFEDGLVDLILEDVGNEPGALPLLSHALRETWERRRGHMLTLAGYSDVGRVKGAITKTADRIYATLTPAQQHVARTIFIRLTELGEGAEDTRRRVALAELEPTDGDLANVEAVLKTLADARLVTTHETETEVAHEALIREWETLRKWLAENRDDLRIHRRLTEEATEWSQNQDESLLYRGGAARTGPTVGRGPPQRRQRAGKCLFGGQPDSGRDRAASQSSRGPGSFG